jgi:hypothetical protein
MTRVDEPRRPSANVVNDLESHIKIFLTAIITYCGKSEN